MVRLFYQVCAALALVAGSGSAADRCVKYDTPFGGPEGTSFNDSVSRYTDVAGILIRSKRRIDAVGIEVTLVTPVLHGGRGGILEPYHFDGKKIMGMQVHQAKKGDHMTVVYVEFTIDSASPIRFGSQNDHRDPVNIKQFPESGGGHLIGFHEKALREVNALGGIWLSDKCVKDEGGHYGY